MSPRAIVYLRVSTEAQVQSHLGLEAQRASCEAAAGRLGLEIAATFRDEGLSGGLALSERPGLLAAVESLQRGDVLLIARADRLGRDFIETALIERLVQKKGCRIISAAGEGTEGDDPASILLRRLMAAFAEHERLIIGLRTRAALRAKKARGERAGNIPWGWRLGEAGKLVEDARERETTRRVRELRDAGFSLRDISGELAGEVAHRGRTGRPLTLKRIHAIGRES